MTRSQRPKATRKMFAKLDSHPMVAGVTEAGWEFGQGGQLGIWTRMWHRDLLLKLGSKIGSWKPAYSAELERWGPKFRARRTGRWSYADAVAAMKPAREA